MAAYFLDSSALVKRYAREIGTAWVIGLFKPAAGNRIYSARITFVEVVAALTRRTRGGRLRPVATAKSLARFRRAFAGKFAIVEVTPPLVEVAAGLAEKHALRGYDAVQLASAIQVKESGAVDFWSADSRLVEAARDEPATAPSQRRAARTTSRATPATSRRLSRPICRSASGAAVRR